MAKKAHTLCPICKKSVKLKGLKSHLRLVHEKQFKCKLCDQNFAFEKQLTKHEKSICREKFVEEFEIDESELIFKCYQCGPTESNFATKEDLEDHIMKNHQDKVYTNLTNSNELDVFGVDFQVENTSGESSQQLNYNDKFSLWLQDFLGKQVKEWVQFRKRQFVLDENTQ